MHTARRRLSILACAAALVLTGCGGEDAPSTADQDTGSAASSGPSASTSTSPSTEPSEPPKSPKPSKSENPAAATVKVTISGDNVSPIAESVKVGVGEILVLDMTSDRAGELHVHSTPEQQLTFEAGTSKVEVIVEQPGQVDIEEHESGALIVRMLVQ